MVTKQKLFSVFFLISLLLFSSIIECSHKVSKIKKVKNRLNSRMKKAGVKIQTSVDCSATSITSVNGSCLNMNPSGLNNYMPSDFSAAWSILGSIISTKIPAGPTICFGDFKGDAFQSNEDLGTDLCNTIPVESDGTFGVIGLAISSLPCSAVTTDISMCIAFDKCGTFALAFNGGLPGCIAGATATATGVLAGVGAAASAISDSIANFSIGFSIGRRFTTDIRIAYRDGDKIHSGVVTTYGHIFADIGVNLPTDFIKIGSKDLGDYFSLAADILLLIDFGDVDTVVNQAINTMKNMKLSEAKTLLSTLAKSGPELTLSVTGVLTLNLNDLTSGILTDLSFTLASSNILLTGGSGRSGMEAGVYFRIGSDIVSDLVNSLIGVVSNFSDIFTDLGFSDISIPSVGIELGLFFTKSALGFQFTFVGFTIKCMFLYSGSDFSCSINAKIFTIIAEAINYVIREAVQFFDKTGRIISTKTKQAFKEAAQAISSSVKKSVGYVKNSAGQLISIGSEAFTDLKNQFEEDLKWLKNGYKNAAKRAVKVLSVASKIVSKKAELIACEIKYLTNKKKRKKCKRSVVSKYDNDSNDDIDTCPNYEYKFTSFSSDQSGNIYALTSHTLDCGSNELLNSFRMERSGSNIRYRYKCITVPSLGTCATYKSSGYDPDYSDLTHTADTLAKSQASCKTGYGINKLTVIKSSTNKVKYEYDCCLVNNVSSCSSSQSTNEDIIDNSILYLDRVLADAGQYRYFQSIKLNNVGDSQMNYSYDSCGISDSVVNTYDTGCNDEGSGSIFYLDRHEVSCGQGNGLRSFGLERDSYQIHYSYKCVYNPDSIDSNDCTINYTSWNSIRSGKPKESLNYLDRHSLKCSSDRIITSFLLERSSSDSIRYKYNCCKATLKNCTLKSTGWTDGGNWQAYYLDRQVVDSTNFNVIQHFELDTDDGNVRYKYTSCELA